MFFRLPKNTIKNLHFGPFGGGSPLPPPPPLNTASAYDFIIKIINFHKNNYLFIFWAGTSLLSALGRTLPPQEIYSDSKLYKSKWDGRAYSEVRLILIYTICVLWVGVDFGGGGRVRTRNALHEVGAPSLSVRDSAVSPRVCREAGGADTSWEPQPHIFYFSQIIYFL